MQIKSLRSTYYKTRRINDRVSADAMDRYKRLERYQRLRSEGCSEATALEVTGWSRATYYRWHKRYQQQGMDGLARCSTRPRNTRPRQWTRQQAQMVMHLRQKNPTWGKRKLWKILHREGRITLSISTVGRIVSRLLARGKIKPAAYYISGRTKPKRRHPFKLGIIYLCTQRTINAHRYLTFLITNVAR